jgi:hypothetical protein
MPAYTMGMMWVAWWAHQDLNLEPTDYESAALTVELWARDSKPSIFAGIFSVGLPVELEQTQCPNIARI